MKCRQMAYGGAATIHKTIMRMISITDIHQGVIHGYLKICVDYASWVDPARFERDEGFKKSSREGNITEAY